MLKTKPRAIAISIIRKNDSILVAEGHDSVKHETFYRPLGGEIEFGEYGHQALRRELREEIGTNVTGIEFIGTLENHFTYEGKPGHEIVLVYKAQFANKSLYERTVFEGHEEAPEQGWEQEQSGVFKAVWMPLRFFEEGNVTLYPRGLLKLISVS